MSIETDIAEGLGNHAIELAAALGLSIAAPNVPFSPPDGKYLDIRHFRNTNLNPSWGDEKTLLGIYQISVVDPKQNGEIPATAVASQVIDAFHKNTVIYSGTVRLVIYENPTLLTTVQDGHKSIYPISIPYRCFKA